jgi:hypothetical protein
MQCDMQSNIRSSTVTYYVVTVLGLQSLIVLGAYNHHQHNQWTQSSHSINAIGTRPTPLLKNLGAYNNARRVELVRPLKAVHARGYN